MPTVIPAAVSAAIAIWIMFAVLHGRAERSAAAARRLRELAFLMASDRSNFCRLISSRDGMEKPTRKAVSEPLLIAFQKAQNDPEALAALTKLAPFRK